MTTTERYDNQKLENLQIAAAKLERGQVFDMPVAASTAGWDGGTRATPDEHKRRRRGTKFQESFKIEAVPRGI